MAREEDFASRVNSAYYDSKKAFPRGRSDYRGIGQARERIKRKREGGRKRAYEIFRNVKPLLLPALIGGFISYAVISNVSGNKGNHSANQSVSQEHTIPPKKGALVDTTMTPSKSPSYGKTKTNEAQLSSVNGQYEDKLQSFQSKYEMQIQSLQKRISALNDNNSEYRNNIASLEKQNQGLINEKASLKADVNVRNEKISSLESRLKDAPSKMPESILSTYKGIISNLKIKEAQDTDRISTLEKKLTESTASISSYKAENEALQKKLDDSQNTISNLKSELSAASNAYRSLEHYKSAYNTDEMRISELEKRLSSLQNIIIKNSKAQSMQKAVSQARSGGPANKNTGSNDAQAKTQNDIQPTTGANGGTAEGRGIQVHHLDAEGNDGTDLNLQVKQLSSDFGNAYLRLMGKFGFQRRDFRVSEGKYDLLVSLNGTGYQARASIIESGCTGYCDSYLTVTYNGNSPLDFSGMSGGNNYAMRETVDSGLRKIIGSY